MVVSTLLFGMSTAEAQTFNPWKDQVRRPSQGKARSIGEYWAGCLTGGKRLKPSERGFELVNLFRRRNFGHPNLIKVIRNLGNYVADRKFGKLIIGDLSQARGGPTLSKHISHQTGLDADIWFWLFPKGKKFTNMDRSTLTAPSVVDWARERVNGQWDERHFIIIKRLAKDPEVQRILVNPVIKRHLCKIAGKSRDWLYKIRPWWGHDDHMHVRLRCPQGSKGCIHQTPPPSHSDCHKSLDWWFSEEAQDKFLKMQAKSDEPVMPKLPNACKKVLKAPSR